MLDWKKFEDEVPTEPRPVLTNDAHGDAPTLWLHDDHYGEWQEAGGHDEVEYDSGNSEEQWREVASLQGYGHPFWAYVNPPEAT